VRIVRMIYEWPPPWQGLAPAPYELTKSQVKLGHTFDIFCARWPRSGPIEGLNKVDFHPVLRAPIHGTTAFTSSVAVFMRYFTWRKHNKIDLIHSHGHFSIWLHWYRRRLEKHFPWLGEMKVPLVAHFHNTVKGRKVKLENAEKEIKNISKYIDWPFAEMADRWAVRSADACIFVSEELKQEAIKYYKANPEKCFVVETGVNTDTFTQVSPEEKIKTRIELKLEPTDKIILNVGAMVERKNIHFLVESLIHLPDNYKLLLMGSGEDAYMDKINGIIAQNKRKHRVVILGYTPYPQVPIAYQAADLFVLPSSFEGLPKAVMESLSCGLQSLVSGFKLSEDILGLEYLEETGPRHIAGRIKDMLEKPRVVDRYKIMRLYSWDTKAREVEEVYKYAKKNHLK